MYYIGGLLQQMIDRKIGAIEVLDSVHREYNERVDAAHENMIWTHPGFGTYYRNDRGRVVVANPFRMVDYWQMCRNPDLAEYRTEDRKTTVDAPA
jgi:4-hydroxyacetophenone monooxygenase